MPAGRLYPGMTGRRLLPTLLGLVLVALLALLRLGDPLPVSAIRDMGFDFEQRLLPRPAHDSPVRVVDIDEASLSRFGQWPWPRDILAKLTDRLAELGAAAIGYDVLFPEADRLSAGNDNDQKALAKRHLNLPPAAGITSYQYKVRSQQGEVAFADTSKGQPETFYKLAQLTREIAIRNCKLPR